MLAKGWKAYLDRWHSWVVVHRSPGKDIVTLTSAANHGVMRRRTDRRGRSDHRTQERRPPERDESGERQRSRESSHLYVEKKEKAETKITVGAEKGLLVFDCCLVSGLKAWRGRRMDTFKGRPSKDGWRGGGRGCCITKKERRCRCR